VVTLAERIDLTTCTGRAVSAFFLALTAAAFLLAGLDRVNNAVDPGFEDTGSYLEGALVIQENGGIANFIDLCLSGRFKVESQHPLYLLALAPFASRDLSFFPKAQLVSLAIGLLVLVALVLIGRALFGHYVALLAAVLLAWNVPFIERSSVVACETLLMLCVLLAWYFMVKGLDQRRYWLLAGVAGGLAYMTKATGIFMIPIFAVSAVILFRRKVIHDSYFWGFFLFFTITASPLIVRNLVVYDTPLFEGANSSVVWLDSYRELAEPKYELLVNWPDHTYSGSNLPTMRSYLESHSLSAVVRRASAGVVGELGLLMKSMYVLPLPRGQRYAAVLTFILFLIGLIHDRDKRRVVFTALTLLGIFAPAAWYFQIIPDIRFLVPVIPLLCLYCGVGCVVVVRYLETQMQKLLLRPPLLQATPYIVAICLIALSAYLAAQQLGRPVLHSVTLADDQDELFSWLRNNVTEADIVLMGPTSRYWGYLWYANFKGRLLPTPASATAAQENFESFNAYLKQRHVTVIVVHRENYMSPNALNEYFDYLEGTGLIEKKPIADWKSVYQYSKPPGAFRIYRL
jgi:hypothetical protein